jgi:hypothetical protein
VAPEAFRLQLGCGGYLIGRPTKASCQFRQFPAIIALRTSDNDNDVALGRQSMHSFLAIFGRLADGVHEADIRRRVTRANGVHDIENQVQGLSGLGHDSKPAYPCYRLVEAFDFIFAQDHGVLFEVADQAADLDMIRLSNNDGVAAFGDELPQDEMDSPDQWTSGIVYLVALRTQLQFHTVSRAMSCQKDSRGGHFIRPASLTRAGLSHSFDNIRIMDKIPQYG